MRAHQGSKCNGTGGQGMPGGGGRRRGRRAVSAAAHSDRGIGDGRGCARMALGCARMLDAPLPLGSCTALAVNCSTVKHRTGGAKLRSRRQTQAGLAGAGGLRMPLRLDVKVGWDAARGRCCQQLPAQIGRQPTPRPPAGPAAPPPHRSSWCSAPSGSRALICTPLSHGEGLWHAPRAGASGPLLCAPAPRPAAAASTPHTPHLAPGNQAAGQPVQWQRVPLELQ